MVEPAKKIWKFGPNLFQPLNPDDLSVAAKWTLITTGDVNTTGLTAVVGPLGVGDTSVCGMAGAASEAQHGVKPTVGLSAELHEFAVYARAGNKHHLYLEDHTVSNASAYFDITDGSGSIGTVDTAATASIKWLGNGWYRCAIRFTGTSAAHQFEISAADDDSDKSFTGDGATVNAYIWKPSVHALRAYLPGEEPSGGFRSTDDGDMLIGGLGEDRRTLTANVSKANATRSAVDRVLLVQNVTSGGSALTDVNLAKVATHDVSHGEGTVGDGCQRITVATDDDLVTSLGLIDDTVYTTGSGTPSKGLLVLGSDGTNPRAISTNSSGEIKLAAIDIEIGAVEIKNAADDTRATVNSMGLCVDQEGIAGHAIDHNGGGVGDGTQRVCLANDTYALVSATNAANATGNRIYVNNNLDQLAGSAIAVGEGALATTGIQRITIATDDDIVTSNAAIKTAVEIIDNCIGTDGSAAPAGVAVIAGLDSATGKAESVAVDSSGVVSVQPAVVPSYEDSVNGEARVRLKGHEGFHPSGTTASAVDSAGSGTIGDPILASVEVLGYTRVTIEVKNAGGGSADDLDRIIVFGSVSGTNWGIVHDSATGAAWATGDGAYLVSIESNSYRYLKAEALCGAADDTTVDCYICAN